MAGVVCTEFSKGVVTKAEVLMSRFRDLSSCIWGSDGGGRREPEKNENAGENADDATESSRDLLGAEIDVLVSVNTSKGIGLASVVWADAPTLTAEPTASFENRLFEFFNPGLKPEL